MYLINKLENVNKYSGSILTFVLCGVECVWWQLYFCGLRLEGSVSSIIIVTHFNGWSITVPFILSSSHTGLFIPHYSLHIVMSRYISAQTQATDMSNEFCAT